MLKNISPMIPPDLLKYMAEMGHGDELVLADANFPGTAIAKRVIRCDGIDMPILLDSVLALLPIDDFVERPVALMNVAKGESTPAIWKTFEDILSKHDTLCLKNGFEFIERFVFYERAKSAYAIVQSGETALYANIILKKGVIRK
jgi:L-fucose mutarotase